MAATPPPLSSSVRTPPTPLHGAAYDNYEPYPLRHFTRSANRRSSRDSRSTPEPGSRVSRRVDRSTGTPDSRRRVSHQSASTTLSPPSSPQHSYKTKVSQRAKTHSPQKLTEDEFAPSAPISLEPSNSGAANFYSTTNMAPGMLPTPVKTHRKKPITNVSAAARVLFANQPEVGEDIMALPKRKKVKKYNGFSLESFSAKDEEGGKGIQIFTDSRDKVPELDETEDNPFITRAETGAVSGKKVAGTSKRRKLSGETKKKSEIEKAVGREDGMVYVFRGKKIFRKFDDPNREEEEASDDEGLLKYANTDAADLSPRRTGRVTRSTFKPKLLFPTEEQRRERDAKNIQEEEEALTDIEEGAGPATPVQNIDSATPASPPSSGRSLRSVDKKEVVENGSATPVIPHQEAIKDGKKKAKVSPFEAWRRTKSAAPASSTSKGKKRTATEMAEESVHNVGSKKTKSD